MHMTLGTKWPRVTKVYSAAISRKVVGKNVHATVPKGNMGYDLYTFPNDCSCRIHFFCFHLAAVTNIRPWPLMPFSHISLKNSELKTTHNTFRDCRVHFFRHIDLVYRTSPLFEVSHIMTDADKIGKGSCR